MPQKKTLHEVMLDEIKDVYNAEKQLTKALPRMAKNATNPKLKEAFQSHLAETQGQIQTLEEVFELLGVAPKGKHCDGIAGIIEEGKAILEEDLDSETLDAALIAAGNRAEHYEIAAYGSLVAWAETLGLDDVASKLHGILKQEKAADEKLTKLAEAGINRAAASAAVEAPATA
jgi:ferritin-like metal-binding protein YciE